MLSQGAQDKVSQTRSSSPGLSHGDTSLVRKEKAPGGATATVSAPRGRLWPALAWRVLRGAGRIQPVASVARLTLFQVVKVTKVKKSLYTILLCSHQQPLQYRLTA